MADYKKLRSVLKDYGEFFELEYKTRLLDKDKLSSGRLAESVKTFVRSTGNVLFEVVVRLEDYWVWVENGRKPGKFPPVDKIKEWISVKPIFPKQSDGGKLPTQEQLAFLIGRKISLEGIKPTHLFEQSANAVYNKFYQDITDAVAQDAQNDISATIRNEFANANFKNIQVTYSNT